MTHGTTCIDDNTNDGFRVSEGAASKQQIFFVESSLFAIAMYAVREQLARVRRVLTTQAVPPGKAGPGKELDKKGRGGGAQWVSARTEVGLCKLLEASPEPDVCYLLCPMGFVE